MRLLIFFLIANVFVSASADTVPSRIEFNRDVRPILSDNCWQCHGPDGNKRKAGLRLDHKESALAEHDGERLIIPGNAAESELYKRLTAKDEDERMPPVESGRVLSQRDIEVLRRWIEQGAQWQAHWAFVPPKRSSVRAAKHSLTDWARNPIDSFILSEIEKEGLVPSPMADRRTLIRRLHFDLVGLPPSSEDVKAFISDKDPQAYESLVDRLLSSPQFGERMALHWLDLARYADTDGFHADNYRSVWPYRDYVIQAFNENKPFDQFTIEQLAGDLLPDASLEQKVASTFNRLNRTTEEGGSQAKEYLAKYAADRARTVGTIWLGATIGCAECHDHKFDPYTAKDFYSFAAFFADIDERGVGKPQGSIVPSPEQLRRLAEFDGSIEQLEKELAETEHRLVQGQSAWEAELEALLREEAFHWRALEGAVPLTENGTVLTPLEDSSLLATGPNPDQDQYTIRFNGQSGKVTAFRLEALTHPTLDEKSLSRGGGNFVLTGFEAAVQREGQSELHELRITRAAADYAQRDFPVSGAIDSDPQTGWAVDGKRKAENRTAVFILDQAIELGGQDQLVIRLKHESKYKRHQIGRFRLSSIGVENPTLDPGGIPDPVLAALRVPPGERTPEQQRVLKEQFLQQAPERIQAKARIDEARKAKEDFKGTLPTTLMTVAVEPRVMRVLPRGNWMDDSGPEVVPAVPEFLVEGRREMLERRATRLDLAKWLVSGDNPLVARAFVNRLWKLYFGTGISKVLDDLGSQGEWPRHLQLLDWLAVEFVESGWDIKHMVRLMVTSNTYRQSSGLSQIHREKDPYNRLHARQSRFRLDAETIRDNALAISGLLVPEIGGASVKPYQPDGYWVHLNFPKREWQTDHGARGHRRALYTFWCRTFLHPSLLAFDAPGREECTASRVTSNTPLQALVLLNDPTYVETARVFAERIVQLPVGSTDERIHWAVSQTLHRNASDVELNILKRLLEKHEQEFTADKDSAEELLKIGDAARAPGLEPAELAAWTSVARVLLNLHETITRY